MQYSDLEKAPVEEAKQDAPISALCAALDNAIAHLDKQLSILLSRVGPAIPEEPPHTKEPEDRGIPVATPLPGNSILAKKLQDNVHTIRRLASGVQRITGRIEL